MESVGDKVFLPNYGGGIVERIEDKVICDKLYKYICITLLLDSMSLLIPEYKLKDYRIRDVVDKETMDKALSLISEEPTEIQKKWTKRYRQNNDKIHEGNILRECEVLRDLFSLKKRELMPPGEQKILDKALSMVVSEVMLVYDITYENALEKLIALSK